MGEARPHRCDACGEADLATFADLGNVPAMCGVHWADQSEALASPRGRMTLACCPACGYVRNVSFEAELVRYDASMDMDLHHSGVFQRLTHTLVERLADRFPLAGARVLDIGCAQGDLLRQLCQRTGCTGTGWDPAFVGPPDSDASGADFHASLAPRGDDLPAYDAVISRHWLEHLDDPYEFLADLRAKAGDRPAYGYLEVPDASYDLATAGWQVIYPHVSYFDAYSLCRIATRAGWRVDATGGHFSGMLRWLEISVNASGDGVDPPGLPGVDDRDRHLAAIESFAVRYGKERETWRATIADLAAGGARPVLWGAGSRSVQFLAATDADRRLAAVVDVNPRKWGRYLPGAGHRVDPPASLAWVQPETVLITNPGYQEEIRQSLTELGISAQILVA